jgi:hypothetical protein
MSIQIAITLIRILLFNQDLKLNHLKPPINLLPKHEQSLQLLIQIQHDNIYFNYEKRLRNYNISFSMFFRFRMRVMLMD